ncbi:MAG TPA: hypothetical protein GX692_00765 [Acholeplasmataceae bacterium]|jgi:hypothetical protein|nr:hypothetical protein [Acholeplasmataceae bacterium]
MFRPSRRARGAIPGGMFAGPNMGQGMPQQNYYDQGLFSEAQMGEQMSNQSSLYPNMQFDRLQFEINENRRRISNLARRVTRLENYLRIRDNSDYSVGDEMKIPDEYSM